MKRFSNSFFLLVSSFLALAACASTSDFKSDDPSWVRTFTLEGPGALEVETSGGNIAVSGHEGNQVRVEMLVRSRGRAVDSLEAANEDLLKDYSIQIEQEGSTIVARAEHRGTGWFGSNNTSISFRVFVPQQMACKLNTSGGAISIEGVQGRQDVSTSGGSITIANIAGDLKARTSGGSIEVDDYSGALDASTSGGPIRLQNARGELDVNTSGGPIRLQDVSGSIDAHTSGGGITANVLELKNQLRLDTSGGSIEVVIPAGLGVDLDLSGNRVHTSLTNFDGEVEKDKVRGKMNGGGIPVKLTTSGGSVTLKYQ